MRKQADSEQRIYTYAFWMALVISVLIVFVLYYSGYRSQSPYKEQLYSVASSLVASICFAVIFTLLTNRELVELVKKEIASGNKTIAEAVVTDVNHHFVAYNPAGIYLPTSGIDTVFNADITNDLKNSTFYFFRGVSAKYVAARVMNSRHPLSRLQVMIIDPRDNRSIRLRARDRSMNPKYSGIEFNDLVLSIKRELYMSIIALFDCRHVAPVEIAYGIGTSVLRLEIFDTALYMSLYHTTKASSLDFPETLRYTKTSVLYDLFSLDTFREFEILENHVRFDGTTDEQFLVQHLTLMGMEEPTEQRIAELRAEYRRFSDDFVRQSRIGI